MSINPDVPQSGGEQEQQIAIWQLKRTIEKLESYTGSGTSVISLLIPPGEQLSSVTGMLTNEYGTASNIKSRVNKNAVLSAITSAMSRLKLYNRLPPNGLAIYCGEIEEDGKNTKVVIDYTPYKPISNFIYLCDSKFHTEHLRELLTNDDTFGFIIMDGKETLMATLSGTVKVILDRFTVDLPKKHGRGGQSSNRFARLRDESRHNYVRKVAERANSLFISSGPTGTNKPTVSGLILGGSADFKNVLSTSPIFDQRLQSIVMKQIDINYGGEQGFNQTIDMAGDVLKDVKLIQEVKLLKDFTENIAKDTKRTCFGITDTIRCLEMSAVEKLIIWDDLPHHRVTLQCVINGETSPPVVKYLLKSQISNPKYLREVINGEEVQMDIMDNQLLLEWFVDNYKRYGASLEFVTNRSAEGAQFCSGFGGIGGLLRWQVDLVEVAKYMQESDEDSFMDDLEDFI